MVFTPGHAWTYRRQGALEHAPSSARVPMCSHGLGTLSKGSGTGGHDGRSGVKVSSGSQTPRRPHRQTQVAWGQGPSRRISSTGTRGTRRGDV